MVRPYSADINIFYTLFAQGTRHGAFPQAFPQFNARSHMIQ